MYQPGKLQQKWEAAKEIKRLVCHLTWTPLSRQWMQFHKNLSTRQSSLCKNKTSVGDSQRDCASKTITCLALAIWRAAILSLIFKIRMSSKHKAFLKNVGSNIHLILHLNVSLYCHLIHFKHELTLLFKTSLHRSAKNDTHFSTLIKSVVQSNEICCTILNSRALLKLLSYLFM